MTATTRHSVVVLICLLLSFFFSGSETRSTASSRASMARLEKHGDGAPPSSTACSSSASG